MHAAKEVADFVSHVDFAEIATGVQGAVATDQEARQEAFLKRKPGAEAAWRPRKQHRKTAVQWLSAVHTQMSQLVGGGMMYFVQ